MNRNNIFLGVFLGGVAVASVANAVDVIRPEDEMLLEDKPVGFTRNAPESLTAPSATQETGGDLRFQRRFPVVREKVEVSLPEPMARERQDWFDVNALPTRQQTAGQGGEEKQAEESARIEEYRQKIKDCMNTRREQLEMDREVYAKTGSRDSLAYLSQTMAAVNQCYEDVGTEILEVYYNNDISDIARFQKKAKSFYVRGTDAQFDGGFCDENCSMSAIFDAQMVKFAEFQIYVMNLLDNRPEEK